MGHEMGEVREGFGRMCKETFWLVHEHMTEGSWDGEMSDGLRLRDRCVRSDQVV